MRRVKSSKYIKIVFKFQATLNRKKKKIRF